MASKPSVEPAPKRPRKLSVGEDVGRQIRAHREASKVSLRELARRLGISPSAISQIETGKSRPSVSTLYAIVSELGMSLDELFSGERQARLAANSPGRAAAHAATPLSGNGHHVQRADRRRRIELESGVRWERLTPQPDPNADFLYMVYGVGGSSSHGDRFIRHSGREYGLIVSGTLTVTVGFDTYELGPGDSICFDSTLPHCMRNLGTEPVHGIWLVIGRDSDQRQRAFQAAAPPDQP